MAIILHTPGSKFAYASNAASQVVAGYQAAEKQRAELEEKEARKKYYEQLAAEKDLANQNAQARLDFLAGEDIGSAVAEGEGVPPLLARPGTATQDDFGWSPPLLDTGTPDLSRVGPGYMRKENAAFRASLNQPNAVIPGTWDHPSVVTAMEGSGDLAKLVELRDKGLANKQDIALIEEYSHRYAGNLEAAFAQAQNELYESSLSGLRRSMDQISRAGGTEEIDMVEAFQDKLDTLSRQQGKSYQELWADTQDVKSDFFEVHSMRQIEQVYRNQARQWQASEDFPSVLEDIRLSPFYEEDSEFKALAILNGDNMPTQAQMTDSDAYGEYMSEVSAAYDIISIGKQKKSSQWMPVRQSEMQKEMMGNLMQAQHGSWQTLRQQLAAGEGGAREFVLNSRALYENAPVPKGLTGQALHAARWRYMIDQQDKAMSERGLSGLPEEGYAWVLRQLKDEELPDLGREMPGSVHAEREDLPPGVLYDPKKQPTEGALDLSGLAHDPPSIYDSSRPEEAINSRVDRAAKRHVEVHGPKKDWRKEGKTLSRGMGPDPARTRSLTRHQLQDFEKEFKTWWSGPGSKQIKEAELATMGDISADEALHYVMDAMDKRNPNWIYGGSGGALTTGTGGLAVGEEYEGGKTDNWFYDSPARLKGLTIKDEKQTWLSIVKEAELLARRAQNAKKTQSGMQERGFEPQFTDPEGAHLDVDKDRGESRESATRRGSTQMIQPEEPEQDDWRRHMRTPWGDAPANPPRPDHLTGVPEEIWSNLQQEIDSFFVESEPKPLVGHALIVARALEDRVVKEEIGRKKAQRKEGEEWSDIERRSPESDYREYVHRRIEQIQKDLKSLPKGGKARREKLNNALRDLMSIATQKAIPFEAK